MKTRNSLVGVSSALLAGAATLALAQLPQLHPVKVKAAYGEAVAQEADPTLSQSEALHIENIQLKMTILRQQEMQLTQEYENLIDAIQKEHPGFTVNRQTNQLMALPKPAPMPAPAPKTTPNADKK